jgi:hypothetical protein
LRGAAIPRLRLRAIAPAAEPCSMPRRPLTPEPDDGHPDQAAGVGKKRNQDTPLRSRGVRLRGRARPPSPAWTGNRFGQTLMRFLFLSRIAIPARTQDTRLAMRWVEHLKYGELTAVTLNRYRPAYRPGRRSGVVVPERSGWERVTGNPRGATLRTGQLAAVRTVCPRRPSHRCSEPFAASAATPVGAKPCQHAAVVDPGTLRRRGFRYAQARSPFRPSGREGTPFGGFARHASATRVSVPCSAKLAHLSQSMRLTLDSIGFNVL